MRGERDVVEELIAEDFARWGLAPERTPASKILLNAVEAIYQGKQLAIQQKVYIIVQETLTRGFDVLKALPDQCHTQDVPALKPTYLS